VNISFTWFEFSGICARKRARRSFIVNTVRLCIAAVVSGESGDDIYEQVKVVIEEQVGPSVWVSTNQPL